MAHEEEHIVIFPFMAKGHTIPLLHLAAALLRRHIRITLITTASTAPFFHRHLRPSPFLHIAVLPFPPHPSLPAGCESTDALPSPDLYPSFLTATTHLRHPFHRLLLRIQTTTGSLPLCVISDFFLGWTLDVCRLLGVPRLVFHGMSTLSMSLCKALWVHQPFKNVVDDDEQLFQVPGSPSGLQLTRADVPDTILNSGDPDDPVTKLIGEVAGSDVDSWGIIVNSFVELDGGVDIVAHFESFYNVPGARAWLVGPLLLHDDISNQIGTNYNNDEEECMRWLDGKKDRSVVYVAFGTQTFVPEEQLEEVAKGLEMAGCNYLWVVRSATWVPQEGPAGGERGRIVKWAPQAAVLRHKAVGGFVSHCGWNSVLESVVAGVPMLAWPMIAEQALNAKHVVELLGAGIRLRPAAAAEGGIVGREEICEGVKEVMEGRRGVRERMEELREMAVAAVGEGGLSEKELNKLIEELRRVRRCESNGGVVMEEVAAVAVDDILQFDLQQGIQIA